jgi:hypothetical protein
LCKEPLQTRNIAAAQGDGRSTVLRLGRSVRRVEHSSVIGESSSLPNAKGRAEAVADIPPGLAWPALARQLQHQRRTHRTGVTVSKACAGPP